MVSYLFGLESMAYMTTGLVDDGVPDYSIESAICKVSATEFLWYAAVWACLALTRRPGEQNEEDGGHQIEHGSLLTGRFG